MIRNATLLIALCSLVLLGCEKPKGNATGEKLMPVGSNAQAGTAPANADVSQEEAEQFAADFATAASSSNLSQVNTLVDWTTILKRAVEPYGLNAGEQQKFVQGAMTALPQNSFGGLKSMVDQGGAYSLVRVVDRGGYKHAVFRLVQPGEEGGINYHDLRLVKDGGRVRADQMFIALTGESLSDTISKNVGPLLNSRGALGKLTGTQKAELEKVEKIGEFSNLVKQQRYAEALAYYDRLPSDLKQRKICMLYRVMAASSLDEQRYKQVIDQYLKAFPGDASVGLVSLDAAAINQDIKLLEKSHQAITEWTGGDPYLTLLIGSLMMTWGETDRAIELTRDVDPAGTGLADAHDYKLTIELEADNFDEVLKQLRILRDEFQYDLSALADSEDFADFVQSPQYQQFIQD